jgi:hypothetical protein
MNALPSIPNRSASAEREDRAAEPIVAAVDPSAASRAAVDEAVSIAADLAGAAGVRVRPPRPSRRPRHARLPEPPDHGK